MSDARVHAVIMAYEHYETFWPLSRKVHLQQTAPFINNSSLLEQTIARISTTIPIQRRWIVTSLEYEEYILEKVGHLIAGTIVEPEYHGTASAILLASLLIQQQDPDAVMLIMPSHHYIPQKQLFLDFVEHAVDFVQHHQTITLFGLHPTYPALEYSYLTYEHTNTFPAPITHCYQPTSAAESQLYYNNNYLWNTNIALSGATTLSNLYKQYMPDLFDTLYNYMQGCGEYTHIPTISFEEFIRTYCKEKTVLPVNFNWHTIETLETFLSLRNTEKTIQDNIIQIDAHDNLVESEGSLVALVGVDNLCVIKNDDIILIAHRDQLNKVKDIIETLKKGHKEDYL